MTIVEQIEAISRLDAEDRVAAYNAIVRAAAAMVADVCDAPALAPQLIPAQRVHANDYNPNKVAKPEMALLERSIRDNGFCMCVVVVPDGDDVEVVDGFHRRTTLVDRLGWTYIPCAVIRRDRADQMAATVQFNRAKGKHDVALDAALVRSMLAAGKTEAQIAVALGMSEEELLRKLQVVGAARLMASPEYNRAWGHREGT